MVTDTVKMIDSFKFVYEGAEVDRVDYKAINLYGKSVQLSINTYPEAAESYTDIKWSSNNSKITVDQTVLFRYPALSSQAITALR